MSDRFVLLACPFCGGKRPAMATDDNESANRVIEWFVICRVQKCGARGPSFFQTAVHQIPSAEFQAANAWNKRK